jgi:hypothetical protein
MLSGTSDQFTQRALIDAWHDLYLMLGTSAAALIGLLFVATSIHLGEVASNPGFRVRSYNSTLYLLMLLAEAIVILVPQPVSFLGAELVVLNFVGLWLPIRTYYTFFHTHPDNSRRGGLKMSRAYPLGGAFFLGIAGGIALTRRSHWGMYMVTVSYSTLLATVVLGTWSIMLGIEQRLEKNDKRISRHTGLRHDDPAF